VGQSAFKQAIADPLHGDGVLNRVLTTQTANGDWRTIRVLSTLERGANGQPATLFGLIQNVAEPGAAQPEPAPMDEAAQNRLSLSRDLRLALENGDIEARYQPQFDMRTGRVSGYEALARWTHPLLGDIPPGEFIPLAESYGLIGGIGSVMLRTACGQAKAWLDAGQPERTMAVNISAAQLLHGDIVAEVANVLAETGLPPHLLVLELTESVFIDHGEDHIRTILSQIEAQGVKLALDDFGTGYSSLGYLKDLPFHTLKIDRCFVNDIETDSAQRALLAGILGLGRGLGMRLVAEGVETNAQVEILRSWDCDMIQGFYFAQPKTAEEIPTCVLQIEAGRNAAGEPIYTRDAPPVARRTAG